MWLLSIAQQEHSGPAPAFPRSGHDQARRPGGPTLNAPRGILLTPCMRDSTESHFTVEVFDSDFVLIALMSMFDGKVLGIASVFARSRLGLPRHLAEMQSASPTLHRPPCARP